MNFITYVYDNKERVGVLKEDKVISLQELLKDCNAVIPKDMLDLIENYDESILNKLEKLLEKENNNYISLDLVKLKAPIPYPKRNIICLGKNYVDHVKEIKLTQIAGMDIPEKPIYFSKIASPAIGDKDSIEFSKSVTSKVDYEVELAIIIGKDGKNIKKEEAENYIFGYTIINDVSARDLQGDHKQWFKGKSLDTFCPMGPSIVHKNAVPFPVNLKIQSKVNGEVRQNSNTKNLIFDIPYILSDLSKGITLKRGDIICTGTPSGVGMGFEPIKVLENNDIVECYIEKIGALSNNIKVND